MSPTSKQQARQEKIEQGEVDNQVWSFRGYEMRPGEFNTAMVHLYRGEITRANLWRQRLDSTTNWAVITTGAAFSLAFSSDLVSHAVIILSNLLVSLFLFVEARRYRYYELWSYRIRLMETDFFAGMLVPPFGPAADWSETLAENLLHPRFPITMWEALGRRLRRNYLWIYIILGLAWMFNISLRPGPVSTFPQLVERARLGAIPGEVVLIAGAAFYVGISLLGLLTRGMHDATGEILPHTRRGESLMPDPLTDLGRQENESEDAWFRPSRKRKQLLSQIITDYPEAIAERLMQDMGRGVTRVDATGMYTGQQRPMLLCAITVTEVVHLKKLVADEDPDALVIVTPTTEIAGKGFGELA